MASSLVVPDDWGFSGKVAVVMGGGAAGAGIGNGRAAAILLARAGARVVVVDRTLDLAGQTVAMIQSREARRSRSRRISRDPKTAPWW